MKLEVRKADICDVFRIYDKLRAIDNYEILAASGETPLDALLQGFKYNVESYCITKDGRPIAIGGLSVAKDGSEAYPWMLATDELVQHKAFFLRVVKPFVRDMLLRYPRLRNFALASNTAHIRWLKWLGFSITRTIDDYGYLKVPFVEFKMERKECVTP
jgi:hypothetical protein